MINQVGIDIVEIKRMKLTDEFVAKVLSKEEAKLFHSFDNKKRKKEFLAGRWAAKEALVKATTKHIVFSAINIGYKNEVPYITNKGFDNFKLSISHENKYAIAIVINGDK